MTLNFKCVKFVTEYKPTKKPELCSTSFDFVIINNYLTIIISRTYKMSSDVLTIQI